MLHNIISRNTFLLLEENVVFITCTNESFTGNYKQQIGWCLAGSWRNRVPAAGATCALWMETVSGDCCGFWAPSDKYFSPDLILHNTETLNRSWILNAFRISAQALAERIRPDATVTNRREPRLHETHSDRHLLPSITAFCLFTQSHNYNMNPNISSWNT